MAIRSLPINSAVKFNEFCEFKNVDKYLPDLTAEKMNVTTNAATTPDMNQLEERTFVILDSVLGAGLAMCLLIGLPGNLVALKNFRNSRRDTLSNKLYIAACTIDLCSSVVHLPVTIGLFNSRRPGVFGNQHFCNSWYFVLLFLQQTSMFVAMLLSVSRTIVIISPFYEVRKGAVLLSIPINLLLYLVFTGTFFFYSSAVYEVAIVYCCRGYTGNPYIFNMYHVYYSLSTGAPPIIVFISFIISVRVLLRKNMTQNSTKSTSSGMTKKRDNARRHASITIAYFSAIFLVCNSLTFANNVLYTYTIVDGRYPGPLYSSTAMFFYAWPICEICCTVLNATLNSVLYNWRMKM